jgi:outer membrane protein OmpA-like peptidoglycan-associated protein
MSLSQQRANSVVNYLVSKGISRSRLTAKGYGETRLVNKCANGVECTEGQHQQNRRTEFRVIQ